MAFSLLRSLTAASRLSVTTIKRQAKRLHKASPELFGQAYPLTLCQEAMARANGFQHWHEAQKVLAKAGADRNTPWWTLSSRNNCHQAHLEALVTLQLELIRDAALVFLGEARDCATPALCLLLEEMSFSKLPGLILVETDKQALQDTALWPAVVALGQEELFTGFRSLDLREPRLPVSIHAAPRHWMFALNAVLTPEEQNEWGSTGEASVLETLIEHYGRERGAQVPDFYPVVEAMRVINRPSALIGSVIHNMTGTEKVSMEMDSKKYLADSPSPHAQKVWAAMQALDQRHHGTGIILNSESPHRPVVALYSRSDPASVILAGAVHAMFFWRYISFGREEESRPILHFGDQSGLPQPPPVFRGTASRSIIVPGVTERIESDWNAAGLRKAMLARVNADGEIVAAGRRCGTAPL